MTVSSLNFRNFLFLQFLKLLFVWLRNIVIYDTYLNLKIRLQLLFLSMQPVTKIKKNIFSKSDTGCFSVQKTKSNISGPALLQPDKSKFWSEKQMAKYFLNNASRNFRSEK
jgi:hypothetical protein